MYLKIQVWYEGERPGTVYGKYSDGSPCFGLRGCNWSIDRHYKLRKPAPSLYLYFLIHCGVPSAARCFCIIGRIFLQYKTLRRDHRVAEENGAPFPQQKRGKR